MSINAYRRVQEVAASPRSTEYRLMTQITSEMIAARDAGLRGVKLMPALHRNRMVWGTFANICAIPGNRLPDDLRATIISIGLWVSRYTSDVMAGRDEIDDLIDVNRAILNGLSNENGVVGQGLPPV
ncbi:flagellar protein FlaF [Novosphingobium sp. PhB165]|jgi:flagellar biosynthesis activator protein FlaF|uniref:flagellar biosynthesis regulator FlaF n=1 Tax=Novosphingobium sp. PhB165 TaxID=2485105 RepID=UPI001046FB81|nr:flagellar biosynthesis regulator FlaF [Novosphingobium sp. PhB165]TCM17713.1 flagellar protein FlaF [Novosphingobium sp. PhB165]